jgi:hypothetical protein
MRFLNKSQEISKLFPCPFSGFWHILPDQKGIPQDYESEGRAFESLRVRHLYQYSQIVAQAGVHLRQPGLHSVCKSCFRGDLERRHGGLRQGWRKRHVALKYTCRGLQCVSSDRDDLRNGSSRLEEYCDCSSPDVVKMKLPPLFFLRQRIEPAGVEARCLHVRMPALGEVLVVPCGEPRTAIWSFQYLVRGPRWAPRPRIALASYKANAN